MVGIVACPEFGELYRAESADPRGSCETYGPNVSIEGRSDDFKACEVVPVRVKE